MIKLNLSNFPGEIPGFISGLELFRKQGWQEPVNADALSVLKSALMLKHWPLEDNSVCQVKLYFVAEMLNDSELLHVIDELNRVCCDGALIHFRAHHPEAIPNCDYNRGHALHDSKFRLLCKQFRQDHPKILETSYGFKDPANCPLNVDWECVRLSFSMQPNTKEELKRKGITKPDDVLYYLSKHGSLLQFTEIFSIVHKQPDHVYGLVDLFDAVPFVMRLYPLTEEQYVSRFIKQYGQFESTESSNVLALAENIVTRKQKHGLPKTLKFTNIGANLGWYTLLLAQCKDFVTVDAFEPTPETVSKLQESVALNCLEDRVKVYPIALSNEKSVCKLFVDGNNAGANSLMEAKSESHNITQVLEIPADTLDNIYLSQPFSTWPELIVMDVEGHEQKVWDGAKGMLAYQGPNGETWRPVIFTEFSPSLMVLRGACTYYHDFAERGYKLYLINHKKLRSLRPVTPEGLDALYDNLKQDNPLDCHDDLALLPF